MIFRVLLLVLTLGVVASAAVFAQGDTDELPTYKLLATRRTKTMQKELDEAASNGYRVLMGAPADDSEMVVFLSREQPPEQPYIYKLLATTRTGTMQKELNEFGRKGFRLIRNTVVAKKRFMGLGGREIALIMEKTPGTERRFEYRLQATERTSTMQKEVSEARAEGFTLVAMVSRGEHMVILEREVQQ